MLKFPLPNASMSLQMDLRIFSCGTMLGSIDAFGHKYVLTDRTSTRARCSVSCGHLKSEQSRWRVAQLSLAERTPFRTQECHLFCKPRSRINAARELQTGIQDLDSGRSSSSEASLENLVEQISEHESYDRKVEIFNDLFTERLILNIDHSPKVCPGLPIVPSTTRVCCTL